MSRTLLLSFAGLVAQAGTLFLPAYPDRVLIVDEATQKVVSTISTEIGLPTSAYLSYDRKKIILTSQDRNGISVLDIASRKVVNHFQLNSGNKQLRLRRAAPDPQDKVLYTVVTEVTKQVDRFEIGKPKYAVIDFRRCGIICISELCKVSSRSNTHTTGRVT